jgi:hypothetical protein
MASKFPKLNEWSEKTYAAGLLGFNLLRDFESEMHRVYPDTQPYSFGYFSETDLNERLTEGWKFLEGGMFDVDDFNKTVGTRFGVRVDVNDRVMYNNNYIMLMGKQHRDEYVLPARKERSKKMEQAADEEAVFVHPSDPEYNRMKDAGRSIAKTERAKVQVKGTPDHGGKEPKPEGDDLW